MTPVYLISKRREVHMPKLRKRTSRYDQLQTLLYGQIRVQGVKPETLIGCCRQTAANRLQNIGGMTINDLLALGRGLDIPIDTLRAAIKYQ
nr:MAG TPA: hypothetical protein [Caudoviricetes sp.]